MLTYSCDADQGFSKMSRATVTVRELKNKDTGIDITVPSQKEVKGLLTSSFEYQVVVVSNLPYFKSSNHKDTDVVQFMVSKKFADFEHLHSQLNEKFSGTVLPLLPKKALLVNDHVAKERRTGLEHFLKFLASTPKLCISSVLLEFLGVNAIKAGKFRKDPVGSGTEKTKDEEDTIKPEVQEHDENGAEQESGLFEDEEQEDAEDFFSESERKEEIGADTLSKDGDTKLFGDQDFGGGFDQEEADALLLIPGASTGTTTKQPSITLDVEDSDLLQIDDDLDSLMKQTMGITSPRDNTNTNEESANDPTQLASVTKPSIKEKPKIVPRSKPTISPKPNTKSDSELKHDAYVKPVVPERSVPRKQNHNVPTKPPIKPRPRPKPKSVKENVDKENNTGVENYNTGDILQYIQANTTEDEVDLFS